MPNDQDEKSDTEFHVVLFDPVSGKMKDWLVSNDLVALARVRTRPKFKDLKAMWFQFKIGTGFTNPCVSVVDKPN
jgi:hypothetical protein